MKHTHKAAVASVTGEGGSGGGGPAPILEVYGNSVLITNGDVTPDTADHTDFESSPVLTTTTRTYTIENNGDADLTDLLVNAPSGYTVTVQPASTVTPSNSTTFTIRFDASSHTTFSGTVSITSNTTAYLFDITAIAIAPVIEISGNSVLITDGDVTPSALDHTDFGSTPLSTTVTRIFTIENTGDADLEDLSVAAPAGYTVTVQPAATVAPDDTTTFSVRFNSATHATVGGTVTVSSNLDDYTFDITATAVAPVMVVSGNSITISNGDATPSGTDHTDFGSTPVATMVTRVFTIQNTGDANLDTMVVTAPSGYTVTIQPTNPVAPSGSTTFSVRFNATTGATFNGNISISSNTTTYVFAITATGVYTPQIMDKFAAGVWGPGSFTRTSDVGQLTVTDASSNTLISTGKLRTINFVAFDNPRVETGSIARAKGLTLLVGDYDVENDRSAIRWRSGGVDKVSLETGLNNTNIGGDTIAEGDLGGIALDAALVLDTAGGLIYSRATGTGDWILRWCDQVSTVTPNLAGWAAVSTGVVEAIALGSMGIWQDQETLLVNPTINVASPVHAQVYVGTPSAIVDESLTAPGSLGAECGLKFRYQDASNYWRMYFDAAGAFKVDLVIAGTPSNQVNVAGVITTSATRRIRVKMIDNTLKFFTKNGTTWTKRGSTITSSVLQAYGDVVPDTGAGWTAANLRSDPAYTASITTLLNAWLAIQT